MRRELARAGFEIDLKQPKVSHGRLEANADTAMAAAAVRWASDPAVSRVELWTGDGDFVKVREVVANAWPRVAVTFRSFEVGTAWAIRRLGRDWMRIGPEYLLSLIHISEPTRLLSISYAVFCLKKKNNTTDTRRMQSTA